MRMFTPWGMNVSACMGAQLEAAGAPVPSGNAYPTGAQFADALLDPLAALPALAGRIESGTKVEGVGRQGLLEHEEIATDARGQRPFRLLLSSGSRAPASCSTAPGRTATPTCSATAAYPPPAHVAGFRGREGRVASQTVLLVVAGKSAQTAARDLDALAEREPRTRWSGPSAARPRTGCRRRRSAAPGAAARRCRRAACGRPPPPIAVHPGVAVTLRGLQGTDEIVVDRVLALTGYVGDASISR